MCDVTEKGNRYDCIIVGGGSAGLTAGKLIGSTLKRTVLLIEKEKMGGDCTWTGCVPSKSLIAAAKTVHAAQKLMGETKVDFAAIRKRVIDNQTEIYESDDSPAAMEALGVTVVEGSATLLTDRRVCVKHKSDGETKTYVANKGVILCTGASPRIPSTIDGLESVPYLTTESIWKMETLPERLTVLGGGPVGCELAQAFSRLGSQVTIVAPKLVPREDPQARTILEAAFADENILNVKGRASAVSLNFDEKVVVKVIPPKEGGEAEEVVGDVLLLALGRIPRVKGMGLEEAGIQLNQRGGIQVNAKLHTSVQHVYAAGDCTGDYQFTHYAGFQGAIAARNILLPLSDKGVLETVPAATFTSPEIASVGLSESQAIEQYGTDKVEVSFQDLKHVDRAICDGSTAGYFKVIHLKKNHKILGASIVGPAAGELICEIAVAIEAGMTFDKLATVMHPYPTMAMGLQLLAADTYYAKIMRSLPLYNALTKVGL